MLTISLFYMYDSNVWIFVKLEQTAKENAENVKLRDGELNARIVELEQSAKESENRFAKLEQKQTQVITNEQEVPPAKNILPPIKDQSDKDNDITLDPISSDQSNLSCDISREQKNNQSKSQNASSGSLQNPISQSKDDLASKLDQSKIKSPCLEPKLSTDQEQNEILELSDIPSQIAEASTLVKIPYNQRVEQGSVPHLAHLFGKAEKTGRKEKLRWYYYSEGYEKKVSDLSSGKNISDQMARTQIYDEIMQYLPGIKREYLLKMTPKARAIYTLFKGIGIDKIEYIIYSADAISSLTGTQIQNIINLYTKELDAKVLSSESQKLIGVKNSSRAYGQPKSDIETKMPQNQNLLLPRQFLSVPSGRTTIGTLINVSEQQYGTCRQLFLKWGGIPRFVLDKASDPIQQNMLEDAIAGCDEKIFNYIGESDSKDLISHKLVHIYTNPLIGEEENDESDVEVEGGEEVEYVNEEPYTLKTIVFASDYVGEK
ncbi:14306_t:CDS:2, partial [Acaulospora colombiana]